MAVSWSFIKVSNAFPCFKLKCGISGQLQWFSQFLRCLESNLFTSAFPILVDGKQSHSFFYDKYLFLCKMCLTVGWKLGFTPSLFLPASSLLMLLPTLCSLLSCHSSHRTKRLLDNALSFPRCISLLLFFHFSLQTYIRLCWLRAAIFRRGHGGAFVIIGHLSIGATAVLFDPNCFDLDEIRADVLICICHAPNVVSWTPETSVLCCHFSPSQKILTLFCVAWCSGWLFDRFKWPFFHCLWWFIGISYVTGTLIHLKISQVVL